MFTANNTKSINTSKIYNNLQDFIETNNLQQTAQIVSATEGEPIDEIKRIREILHYENSYIMYLVRKVEALETDFQIQIIEVDSDDININREAFMNYFRSNDYNEQLSADDCAEVFATSIKGSSDLTAEFLNQITSDYSAENVVAVETENIHFLFGKDAVATYDDEGIEELIEGIKANHYIYGTFIYTKGITDIFEFAEAINGYDEYAMITEEEYNKINDI